MSVVEPQKDVNLSVRKNASHATPFRKNNDRDEKQMQNDYRYGYKYFMSVQESVPDYIRENLRKMPSNKGYIWRDCWCFGENDAEKGQPIVMFEKARNGVLRIHEVTREKYRIFEKAGGQGTQRVLVSETNRN